MFTFAWRARPSGGNSHFFYDGPKKCKKVNNFMKSKKIHVFPCKKHKYEDNSTLTFLFRVTEICDNDSTISTKIFILHKIIGTVSCEGGRGAILRYRSFLHSDPGAMRVIDTIRRDISAFFGHLLLVWHFVWLPKNTKLIQSFLETRIFRFHIRVVTSLFCVLLFVYCLLLGSIPLFDVPVLFVFSHGWG